MDIKKEIANLNRSDFNQVESLVNRIIKDIVDVSNGVDNEFQKEIMLSLVKDYMIDLINPDLLGF